MKIRSAVLALLPGLLCLLASPVLAAQKQPNPPQQPVKAAATQATSSSTATAPASKYADESVVYQNITTSWNYQADGTGVFSIEASVRAQSANGVRELGLITFPCSSSTEQFVIDYVRVRKPDGTIVTTPPSSVQDMPMQVTVEAPLYSDLHVIEIPVKSLSAGDTLEYKIHVLQQKPYAPGQFWGYANFITSSVILHQTFELSFPKGKYVQTLSPKYKPVVTQKDGRVSYLWTTSQLQPTADRKQPTPDPDALPSVAWTTFHNWQQVGDWYAGLARSQMVITPDIQAKANELIAGKTTDEARIEAIYHYVSTQIRYIGVDFGIGRYQPHPAETVLENQYGDCKDKDTLLRTLLKAAGYDAWPALISATSKLHPEIPTPRQFDHVITAVPLHGKLIWLDSTPEVAPYRMLTATLRGKQALVMPTKGKPKLMWTPANGPFPFVNTYLGTGKLSTDGILTGHIAFTMRGDAAVSFRELFHLTPRANWQQAAQLVSERLGFGGKVSNVSVSPPEQTDTPIAYSYDYTRKQYGSWSTLQIVPLMPLAFGLSSPSDSTPAKPVKLGSPSLWTYTSVITLPAGYTATVPTPVKYATSFAVYTDTSTVKGDQLTTVHTLQILVNKIPVAEIAAYKKFKKDVENDEGQMIQLAGPGTGAKSNEAASNPKAAQYVWNAWQDMRSHDTVDARSQLEMAQQLNPEQAWLWRGYARLDWMAGNRNQAISDLRKGLQDHPKDPLVWSMMAAFQMDNQQYDAAAQTLRNELKVLPGNTDAETRLGSVLMREQKYSEAASVLESASKQLPTNRGLRTQTANAELRAGERAAGLANLQQALAGTTDPVTLNDAAYELADSNLDLPTAEAAVKKALATLSQQTAQITLANLTQADLSRVSLLAQTWDTMGWVYFREGNLDQAANYCRAAWNVTQDGVVGGHLGQIYEKEGKRKAAIKTYTLALAGNALDLDPAAKNTIHTRLDALGVSDAGNAGEELGKMRTIYLPRIPKIDGSADFFILLSPGKVDDVQFISGDDRLKVAAPLIEKAQFAGEFPAGATAKLVRRGIVYCSTLTKTCQLTLLLPQSVRLQ